jgi:Cdc6-like AAA superfamily ATPase
MSKSSKKLTNKSKGYKVHDRHRKLSRAFFAYPSKPQDRADIIESAIGIVNGSRNKLKITSWANMKRQSSRIISDILHEINESDSLVADISDLNPNVLFEVGYAFGKQKKLILFTQGFSTANRTKDLNELIILKGWYVGTYHNSDGLANSIIIKKHESSKVQPEMSRYLQGLPQSSIPGRGLYLRGFCDHEYAVSALRAVKSCIPELHVDDWTENRDQNLLWYVREVSHANAIFAIWIPKHWDYSREMNARFAFVCGLAVGLGKKVHILGLPGFETPFDYQDFMLRPDNNEQIQNLIKESFESQTLQSTEQILNPSLAATEAEISEDLTDSDKEVILLEINIGDTIAENEETELSNYFVQTGQFRKALNARKAVVVGFKGTGKTATFFQIGSTLQNDVRNLVCEINPSDYKMARFLMSLKKVWEFEGHVGYTMDTVWKLVCYCEILNKLRTNIKSLPLAAGRSPTEHDLISFVEQNSSIIETPLERKLEIMSAWIEETNYQGDNFTKRTHDRFLNQAKDIIKPFMKKVNRCVILVDNLDKAWSADNDLMLQSQMVQSLLSIHNRLRSDLGGETDVSVIIFLRRNIYEYVLSHKSVSEPDKLIADTIELVWNDSEMLLRVIDERFSQAVAHSNRYSDNFDPWAAFFCSSVDGVPTKEWIFDNVLPRPRDLIHFINKAIEWAINRGHSSITEVDLKTASEDYSGFALAQVVAEYKAEHPWLNTAVWSFLGESHNWGYEDLTTHLEGRGYGESDTSIKVTTSEMVTVLTEIGFLGVCINSGSPEFAVTVQQSRPLVSRIKSYHENDLIEFVVHPVFHRHLRVGVKELVNNTF